MLENEDIELKCSDMLKNDVFLHPLICLVMHVEMHMRSCAGAFECSQFHVFYSRKKKKCE